MKIVDKVSDENYTGIEAIFMRDVIYGLVGEDVNVFLPGVAFSGKLLEYNGSILHIDSQTINARHLYIRDTNILAISASK
jgi:hypothetical protein